MPSSIVILLWYVRDYRDMGCTLGACTHQFSITFSEHVDSEFRITADKRADNIICYKLSLMSQYVCACTCAIKDSCKILIPTRYTQSAQQNALL